MDKFAVIRKIGSFSPSVADTFDNVGDASAYANIMRRKNNGWEYNVYQLNEELLAPHYLCLFNMSTAEEIGTSFEEVMCEIYGFECCHECALRYRCTLADHFEG